MAHYGQIIDSDYIPERDKVYQMFVDYFNNPVMTKVKTENNFSLYICKSYCLTSLTCLYIIVFVDSNNDPMGSRKNLEHLRWVSFQTRTLDNYHPLVRDSIRFDISSHGYTKELKGPLLSKIYKTKVDEEASTYLCDEFGLTLTLLHTKQKTAVAYQKSGNIILALEGFETIVTFT